MIESGRGVSFSENRGVVFDRMSGFISRQWRSWERGMDIHSYRGVSAPAFLSQVGGKVAEGPYSLAAIPSFQVSNHQPD